LIVPQRAGYPLFHHPLVERLLHGTAGRAAAFLLARTPSLSDPVGAPASRTGMPLQARGSKPI
jgi:hypothetical protein